MDIIETRGDFRVRVEYDDDSAFSDPREWMSTEIVGHPDYATSDPHFGAEHDALRERGMGRHFGRYLAIFWGVIAVKVHKYEHSGMALSTQSFEGRVHHARWDSGMIGWAYIYPAIQELSGITDPAAAMAGEIEELGRWCNGEVYGYIVEQLTNGACGHDDCDEHLDWTETDDTCWGLIGYDYAQQAALEALDNETREFTK